MWWRQGQLRELRAEVDRLRAEAREDAREQREAIGELYEHVRRVTDALRADLTREPRKTARAGAWVAAAIGGAAMVASAAIESLPGILDGLRAILVVTGQ